MSKKTIVLADNSYTIRRIVELSFSEEQDIQLVSFENSLNLREKLLELRPQIVLVDIKLPDFDGYQVCKFIQDTPSLQHSKVFLLKGGFEPIDEEQLKNLRYVDIITKPFDSNALVSNVKKLLEEMPEPGPVSATPPAAEPVVAKEPAAPAPPPVEPEVMAPAPMPDDLPEIDAMPEADSEISFSDIKDEIDSDGIMAGEDFSPAPTSYPDDEILPSEEITQAQSSHPERDNLAVSGGDDLANPFEDDMSMEDAPLSDEELAIKRNIALQEKELEIGSLTVEEMNIQKDIERMRQNLPEAEAPGMELDDIGVPDIGMGDEPEPSELDLRIPADKDDDTSEMFRDSSLDDLQEPEPLFAETPSAPEPPQMEEIPEMPEPQAVDDMPEAPIASAFPTDDEDIFGTVPQVPQVDYDVEPETAPEPLEMAETFTTRKMAQDELEEPEVDEYIVPEPEPQAAEPVTPAVPEPPAPPFMEAEEEVFAEPDEPVEPLMPEAIEPEPQIPTEMEIPQAPEPETFAPEPPVMVEPEPEVEVEEVPEVEAAQQVPPAVAAQHEEILRNIEDKLTHSIKEMLWEIVPPLAEKIIKEEIANLTAETEASFK